MTAWLVSVSLTASLEAHDFRLTESQLHLGRQQFVASMICDLDALALGASQEADSALLKERLSALPQVELEERLDNLRQLFQRRVRVRFDGRPQDFQVDFPDYGSPHLEDSEEPTLLGTRAVLRGSIPEGAEQVSFFASRAFPPVRLEVYRSDDEVPLTQGEPQTVLILQRGARSQPLPLSGPLAPSGTLEVAGRYLVLGFWHILPEGLDHILFVLGLFLPSTSFRPLLLQVTAFTAAHTLTLALSIYDVVSLPPRPVETLIALSIVYVAVENLLTSKLKPWRVGVVFAFGLLHGLGFAGVLRELGLPQEEYLPALLSFNVGVELGQLAVILGAFLVVGWMRHRPDYRRSIVIPGSLGIALLGLYWAAERGLGL